MNEAWKYSYAIYKAVDNYFDFSKYDGKATDAKELLKENPDVFFNTVDSVTNDMMKEAKKGLENDRDSHFAQKNLIKTTIRVNHMRIFKTDYQRFVLGKDVPEPGDAQAMTEKEESWAYKNVENEDDINAILRKEAYSLKHEQKLDPEEHYDWEKLENGATSFNELTDEQKTDYLKWEHSYIEKLHKESLEEFSQSPFNSETIGHFSVMDEILEDLALENNYQSTKLGINTPELEFSPIISKDFVFEHFRTKYYEQKSAEKQAQKETGAEIKTNMADQQISANNAPKDTPTSPTSQFNDKTKTTPATEQPTQESEEQNIDMTLHMGLNR